MRLSLVSSKEEISIFRLNFFTNSMLVAAHQDLYRHHLWTLIYSNIILKIKFLWPQCWCIKLLNWNQKTSRSPELDILFILNCLYLLIRLLRWYCMSPKVDCLLFPSYICYSKIITLFQGSSCKVFFFI
jgi:hypothetical protein